MVKLSDESNIIILEGDEYLSSPLDMRPKFHLYKPDTALLSGIAWDHVNVFPTFENYVEQFSIFCNLINNDGILFYNSEDENVCALVAKQDKRIHTIPYKTPEYFIKDNRTVLIYENFWKT
jgi:UDP-N-acetylmuramate: L-alanyl-gamma-D-glutamyl-meso-diaminopimelate ligase